MKWVLKKRRVKIDVRKNKRKKDQIEEREREREREREKGRWGKGTKKEEMVIGLMLSLYPNS